MEESAAKVLVVEVTIGDGTEGEGEREVTVEAIEDVLAPEESGSEVGVELEVVTDDAEARVTVADTGTLAAELLFINCLLSRKSLSVVGFFLNNFNKFNIPPPDNGTRPPVVGRTLGSRARI